MSLLEECISSLRIVKVYAGSQANVLFMSFENQVDFTFYGRIDWTSFDDHQKINNANRLLEFLADNDNCLIFWNDASLPVLETTIQILLDKIDDVLAVSFDTWVLIPSKSIVIEFYHDGDITIGNLVNKIKQ